MSGRGIIAPEPDQVCEICGNIDECRPYGPEGEQICFDCGMKDPEMTKQKMAEYIFGETPDAESR
jgi:hypothetical protein